MLRFSTVTLLLSFFSHLQASAQSTGDYQSVASGPWSTIANWQTFNGTAWVAATSAPNSTNGIITIQSPHVMQITANVSLDQVVINAGATINWTGGTCTFVNGVGVDLLINGTFGITEEQQHLPLHLPHPPHGKWAQMEPCCDQQEIHPIIGKLIMKVELTQFHQLQIGC